MRPGSGSGRRSHASALLWPGPKACLTGWRRPALAIAALLALPPAAEGQDGPDLAPLRERALELVNESRREEGLDALTSGGRLDEAAQAHAEDMLRRDYYAHASPEGRTVRDRYLEAGGGEWEFVAENIARCTGCPWPPDAARIEELHQGWMDSPGHRANILAEGLSRFGFGLAGEEGGDLYAVQTFAGPGLPRGGEAPGGSDPVAEAEALALALSRFNEARREAGVPELTASEALTRAAEAAVPEDLSGFGLEGLGDPFDSLPEGEGRDWSRIATLAGTCGGCGTGVTRGDVETFVSDWLSDDGYRDRVLDPGMTHLGFVLRSGEEGRKVALALVGEAR